MVVSTPNIKIMRVTPVCRKVGHRVGSVPQYVIIRSQNYIKTLSVGIHQPYPVIVTYISCTEPFDKQIHNRDINLLLGHCVDFSILWVI